MSSGGGSSTTNTTSTPWAGIQPWLSGMYADANSLYKQGMPEYFPGQTYVDRNPLENMAQAQNLAYSQDRLPGLVDQAFNAQSQMLNAPDVANNPYVGGMADTIERRLNRNFSENLNPAIGSSAVAAGQYGGSRQGIAQGLALRGTQEAYGDALAQLYGDAYGQGLEQQGRGMALTPQTAQMGMMPNQIMSDVGGYMRQEDEMALNEEMARYNYQGQAPYDNLAWYNSVLQGAPWGGSSTTSGSAGSMGRMGNAAAGGLLGYGVGSAMTSAVPGWLGALGATGWGMPLAVGGALLGGLFS